MNIILSKNSGFCPGVKRADTAVRNLLKKRTVNEKIYTLGALIHNDTYTSELKDHGVEIISIDDIEPTLLRLPEVKHTVVIRTHGITKEQNDKLYSLTCAYDNFSFIDMTCPSVKKIHKIADENTSDEWNDLHMLFGAVCAVAELQIALPGELRSTYPLRQILDRRPFI